MIRYLSKRVVSSLIALVIFLTLLFFVAQVIIPTDFTTQFAMGMNREARERLAEELGLNQPLWVRYLEWWRKILTGSLGTSFYGPPVVDVLMHVLPFTLLVFVTGTLIAFQFGQWLGKVVAWRRPGFLSGAATLGAIALYTSFPPWLAFLTVYFLIQRFQLLTGLVDLLNFDPSYDLSQQNLRQEIWQGSSLTLQQVVLYDFLTLAIVLIVLALLRRLLRRELPRWLYWPLLVGGWIGSWFALGFGPQGLDVLYHASVPILTYVLLSFGETMLIMRTSMTDTLKEDYVITARAKGLSSRVVRDRHAARNALLPVFSRLVVSLPYLLTGLVILEYALEWPGFSGTLFNSMYNQDIPVVMGALLVVGLLSAVIRLILDVLYMYLDPRVRHRTIVSEGTVRDY
jgi:peptide/nickel transport system permease protein